MRRPADNPFRSACIDRIDYQPVERDLQTIYQQLHSMQIRAALSGPHGTGKSCLLDALCKALATDGHQLLRLQMHANQPAPALRHLRQQIRSQPQAIVIIDGADCLSACYWWALTYSARRNPGLLITTHDRLLLPELHRQHSTPQILKRLLLELAPHLPQLPDCHALFDRYRGNIRDCLRHCYFEWQDRRL